MKRRGCRVGEQFLVGADRPSQQPEQRLSVEHDVEQTKQCQPAQIVIADVRPFVGESGFEAVVRLDGGKAIRQDDHRPDHADRDRKADARAQGDTR